MRHCFQLSLEDITASVEAHVRAKHAVPLDHTVEVTLSHKASSKHARHYAFASDTGPTCSATVVVAPAKGGEPMTQPVVHWGRPRDEQFVSLDAEVWPVEWTIPEDCDTSCPARISFTYTSNSVTEIQVEIAYSFLIAGAAIGAGTLLKTLVPPGVDLLDTAEVMDSEISLEVASPGDILLFLIQAWGSARAERLGLQRDAGSFRMVSLGVKYVSLSSEVSP